MQISQSLSRADVCDGSLAFPTLSIILLEIIDCPCHGRDTRQHDVTSRRVRLTDKRRQQLSDQFGGLVRSFVDILIVAH